jgi:hypothetical protein
MHYSKILSYLILITLLCSSTMLEAQRKEERSKETGWAYNTTNPKDTMSYAQLGREEKNTMTQCPLHKKAMKLSDKFMHEPDMEETIWLSYPFAKVYHYRRHCSRCNSLLHKEMKKAAKSTAE